MSGEKGGERQRRAFLAVASASAVLLSVAAVLHFQYAPQRRDSLLQTQGGFERRMQALKELKAQGVAQSVLFGAEKQAYMNGFNAGEQAAETDVTEDDALKMAPQQPLSLAALMRNLQGDIGQSEEANAMKMRLDRMDKIAGLDSSPSQQKKQSALAHLAMKAAQPQPEALAKAGSQQALKLMDFCARSFKGDEMLQRFCYDRLISEPSSLNQEPDSNVQQPQVEEEEGPEPAMPEFAIVQPPGDPRPELFRVVPIPQEEELPSMDSAPRALMEAAARVHKAKQAKPQHGPDVEVKARSLQQSIDDAHKMGLKGSPKAIVYHEDGENALYVLDKAAKAQSLAQGAAPTQMMAQVPKPKLEVDAPSLQDSIERAHAMGMTGVPRDIVYHPVDGSPEIYKLTSSKSYPSPDGGIRTRHYL
mmetsp:Transcript_20473/g.32022  ORF Transcript_20473/g.32022 Transcript_20473/m.32022 type:complete len:418 (+) Transcript_20473:64-1317(+)